MGLTDFLRRHRRKLFVALGIAGSGYYLVQLFTDKLREWQERLILERLAKDNLERRFEQNQKDATFTIMALLPTVSTQILDQYDVESIKQELQALRSPADATVAQDGSQTLPLDASDASVTAQPRSKSELWNEIKVQSLCRAFTLLYSSALLVLVTRLQLNILGRRAYVESVRQMANSAVGATKLGDDLGSSIDEDLIEDEVNRQYLTFSWWLLHRGWEGLASRIEHAVVQATKHVDPRTHLGFSDLQEILGRIQFSVDHPSFGSESFVSTVFPPVELETFVLEQMPQSTSISAAAELTVNPSLRALLDESADIVDSPNAAEVLQRLVHVGLDVLTDRLAPLYTTQEHGTVRLASALAAVTRQAHQMAAGSPLTNDYIDAMVEVPELDAMCAVIYSNY